MCEREEGRERKREREGELGYYRLLDRAVGRWLPLRPSNACEYVRRAEVIDFERTSMYTLYIRWSSSRSYVGRRARGCCRCRRRRQWRDSHASKPQPTLDCNTHIAATHTRLPHWVNVCVGSRSRRGMDVHCSTTSVSSSMLGYCTNVYVLWALAKSWVRTNEELA